MRSDWYGFSACIGENLQLLIGRCFRCKVGWVRRSNLDRCEVAPQTGPGWPWSLSLPQMISSVSCLRTRLQSQCWHAWALSHSMEIASIQLNHIESNSYNSLLTFAYNILIILGFFSRHLLSMHSQESESFARIDSNFRMRMAQVDSNKNLWCTAVWLNRHRLDRFSKGATTLLC